MKATTAQTLLTFACLAILCAATAPPAYAESFKSVKECTVGARVADGQGKTGTIVRIDGTLCLVKRDDRSSNSYAYLFWMLHSEGASAETDDKLIPGKYACYAGRNYTFMDIFITGANTYAMSNNGGSGRFHVEAASRRIVYETGPLVKANSKLTRGPNINLNMDGGSFYGTTCSYQKQ